MNQLTSVIGVRTDPIETSPGNFVVIPQELPVTGEIRRSSVRFKEIDGVKNSNVQANTYFSMIGSDDLFNKFSDPLYIIWKGIKWNIDSIDFVPPRINFKMGEVYNE